MRAVRLSRSPLSALLLLTCCCTTMPARAGECSAFFDDGSMALVGRPDPAGVGEPPVPVYLDGGFVGDFRLIEVYDQANPLSGLAEFLFACTGVVAPWGLFDPVP